MQYYVCPIRMIFLNSEPTQRTSEIANLTLGQVCQKEGFSSKRKCSDRAQVHLCAVSMSQNRVISDNCYGMLQIFDLFFAGSQVATVFVMSHTYCIYWDLFIHP